jgi:[acyl-carrier-protein] S-malonyltransferase
MAHAFIFPGQGSQQVGMGRALAEAFPAARHVFEEVDDALSDRLTRVMWEGPESDLTLTENTQPALMAVSLAAVRALEAEFGVQVGDARFVAGHSLGEYSALAAAGALSLGEAAELLRLRGRAMQDATPVGLGAMAALLGLDYDAAREIAAEAAQGEVCEPANDNAPGQVVVSGHKSAVERAVEIAKARGAKRAILLNVSAPFHSALMDPAAHVMRDALDEAEVHSPKPPLVANVTASAVNDPAEIRRRLVEQVTATVRWRESVAYMADQGVHLFCELGSGKVLGALVKRCAEGVEGLSAGAPKELEALAARLNREGG